MANYKAASFADRDKAAALLERIRSEQPEFWPHGLSPGMFNAGDLFLIRKTAAEDPVGFVGWQERSLGRERVGLYSIGVLPEYRNCGIAKAAVSDILVKRARGVDRVAALVAPGNLPSEKLAESLGVTRMDKLANAFTEGLKWIGRAGSKLHHGAPVTKGNIAARWAGMVGTPLALDAISYGRDPQTSYFDQPLTTGRAVNGVLNAAIGRWAGGSNSGVVGFEKAMMAPLKDLVFQAIPATESMKHMADRIAREGTGGGSQGVVEKVKEFVSDGKGGVSPWAMLGGAGLLSAGVGGAGYLIQKAIRDKADAPITMNVPQQGGRLKVTLPTKNPGDSETTLDLPFDQNTALTPSLRHRLDLDTRRQLYAETKERIRRRTASSRPSPFKTLEAQSA